MKKIISLILLVCMALTLNMTAFADDASADKGRVEVSLDYIIDNWIETNYQYDVNISRIVGLCDPEDTSGKNIGHLVTFEKDGIPNGYIVLSREEDDYPIVEFSLGGESVYDRLEAQIATNSDAIEIAFGGNKDASEVSPFTIVTNNILYTNFINYSLAIKNDNHVLLFDQYNNVREFKNNVLNDGIVTYDFYSGYYITPPESTTFSSKMISGATNAPYTMDNFETVDNEGNCAPTAATNIINLYANNKLNGNSRSFPILLANDSVQYTYNRLCDIIDYKVGEGVAVGVMVEGIKNYCPERGRTCSIDKYSYNYWSDYTRDIGKNVPIYLSTAASDGSHAQVVVGYREYSNGEKYLMIYSGWYSVPSYVKFKASYFTRFSGWAIYIS